MGPCASRTRDEDGEGLENAHEYSLMPTPSFVQRRAHSYMKMLPFPPPVTIGILCGAAGSGAFGFRDFMLGFFIISLLTPKLYSYCMKVLAKWIVDYIEKVDRDIIGVDVTIGAIDLTICYGRMVFEDLKVMNPEGFRSEYLFYAKSIVIDIDMLELIKSRGRRVVVEELIFRTVDAIIEYNTPVFGVGKQNLQEVLDFMGGGDNPEEAPSQQEEKEEEAGREYTVEVCEVLDMQARMDTMLGPGARVACADLRYKEFSEEVHTMSLPRIIQILFKSVAKSILVNIASIARLGKKRGK